MTLVPAIVSLVLPAPPNERPETPQPPTHPRFRTHVQHAPQTQRETETERRA